MKRWTAICWAGATVFLAGCASVSVKDERVGKSVPGAKPKRIYVERFSTEGAAFNVDREGKELAEFKKATAKLLQNMLIERLPEIAPSSGAPTKLPREGWLIKGRFVRVNQGSRALRSVMGLGLGATKMETEVEVYDLRRSKSVPFFKFRTTGGSNAEPGAVLGAGPLNAITYAGVGVGVIGNAIHGITEDSQRTSREIRNALLRHCQDSGLMPKKVTVPSPDGPTPGRPRGSHNPADDPR